MDFGSFKWLTGDCNFVDYGGKWIRRVGERRFHIIELMNWIEAVGEREAAEVGAKYCVDLSEVDLTAIDPTKALKSCGYEQADSGAIVQPCDGAEICDAAHADLCIAEACHGYGANAPLWGESGNNYLKLMRSARSFSRSLDDAAAHEDAMDRPVNKIGTSARNYMIGNLWSR